MIGHTFSVSISHSLAELDPEAWDTLSNGTPFQSYRWYRYGERVMADCRPTYIILSLDNRPIARATFWLVKNEPLPLPPGIIRTFIQELLTRWPLMICRAPLANSTGLILPTDPELRIRAIAEIARLARNEFQRQNGSFLIFDYLTKPETNQPGWPQNLFALSISDPGTILPNRWENFEAFLASGNKKDRQHYKRTLREVEILNCRVAQKTSVKELNDALELIRQVEASHGSPPNPWAQAMLENLSLVEGTFLEARIDDRLVGCGLLFEDNHTQLTATLGLARDIPFVYFQLLYTSLQLALEHKVKALRWGSGAYEIKKQLGFELELNNFIRVTGRNAILNLFLGPMKKYGN